MEHSFDDKRIWAKGLLVGCPFKTPLEDCPLKNIRKLSLKGRIAVIDSMSDPDLDAVLDHHWKCQKERKQQMGT
jgi:hypothetical protein